MYIYCYLSNINIEALSISQIALTVKKKKERLLFQGGKEANVEMNQ